MSDEQQYVVLRATPEAIARLHIAQAAELTGIPADTIAGLMAGNLVTVPKELPEEARFLLERISEWESDGLTDENASDWMGHVDPSKHRLTALLDDGTS